MLKLFVCGEGHFDAKSVFFRILPQLPNNFPASLMAAPSRFLLI